jgi:hypothetical protein
MKTKSKKGESQKAENIAKARDNYDRRADNRPKQKYIKNPEEQFGGHWEKINA